MSDETVAAPKTWWQYLVLRKDLAGGAAVTQAAHAARESGAMHLSRMFAAAKLELPGQALSFGDKVGTFVASDANLGLVLPRFPESLRVATLGATKAQLAELAAALEAKGVPFYAMTDTDGELAGSTTALGFVTEDRDALRFEVPMLAGLKTFPPKEKPEP